MRRTKIVATLGPASSTPQAIEKLILGGLDVVRLNFSHGKHEEHREHIQVVREVSKRLERSVACLQDLSGPKIRTGSLVDSEGVPLETGASFILTTEDILGTRERVSSTYKDLPRDVRIGNRVLLDDGLIELEVKGVDGDDVITEVINGGFLKPQKGINLPGTALSVPSLTPKDREDAAFGCKLDIDFIALSFVRAAADIRDLKELVAEQGRADILVIAKIEKPEAVEHLDSILDVADGVMVARGDLGVELPAERVPTIQKEIIYQANRRGKAVITATQMLESMVHHPRPTRAEASDVANAILDGTDAVMLSAETAVGRYPDKAVTTMSRIARYTEESQQDSEYKWVNDEVSLLSRASIPRATAEAACGAAHELNARYIVVFTESGFTARLVSHFRPQRPIIGITPSERVYHQLCLLWGVRPLRAPNYASVSQMLEGGLSILGREELVKRDDVVVFVFGASPVRGATDMIKIHKF